MLDLRLTLQVGSAATTPAAGNALPAAPSDAPTADASTAAPDADQPVPAAATIGDNVLPPASEGT